MVTVADIKPGLNMPAEYTANDDALQFWLDAVVEYLRGAGVAESNITPGIVARGVDDLWRYGGGDVKFSKAFEMMAIQASYKAVTE